MIAIKTGVVFNRLIPEIYNLFPALEAVFEKHAVQCWIKSAHDGTHEETSKHFLDQAIDLCVCTISPATRLAIIEILHHRLGSHYNILMENWDTAKPNIHIEIA